MMQNANHRLYPLLMISSIRMLVLVFLLFTPKIFAIDFEDNGYKDLVVTIHPDVPETHGEDIINNIKVQLLLAF